MRRPLFEVQRYHLGFWRYIEEHYDPAEAERRAAIKALSRGWRYRVRNRITGEIVWPEQVE
jgi:hypothetical protein